ncbi:hypothetical protein HPB47_026794 [Ixodes persulcatus]|uniref:Uncharacterized protein n=1 Tax=Ixodes persulcatus TaxID=34615 RepID=A0AC60PYC7_IXOPE|nr:hypothetical protein HPB47_026794 [Ixodes persulcatus]
MGLADTITLPVLPGHYTLVWLQGQDLFPLKDTRLREAGAEAVYCLARGAPKGPNIPRAQLNHQGPPFPGHGYATHSQTWVGEPTWLGVRSDATHQAPTKAGAPCVRAEGTDAGFFEPILPVFGQGGVSGPAPGLSAGASSRAGPGPGPIRGESRRAGPGSGKTACQRARAGPGLKKYLYSQKATFVDVKQALHARTAAEKYKELEPVEACHTLIRNSMLSTDVCDVLEYDAKNGNLANFDDPINKLLKMRGVQVLESKAFIDESKKIVLRILKNTRLCVKEYDVIKSVYAWAIARSGTETGVPSTAVLQWTIDQAIPAGA